MNFLICLISFYMIDDHFQPYRSMDRPPVLLCFPFLLKALVDTPFPLSWEQSIYQLSNQSMAQLSNQPCTNCAIYESIKQSMNQLSEQSINQLSYQWTNVRSMNQLSIYEPIAQSMKQLKINQWADWLSKQASYEPRNQKPTNQATNQPS